MGLYIHTMHFKMSFQNTNAKKIKQRKRSVAKIVLLGISATCRPIDFLEEFGILNYDKTPP